MIHHSLAHLMMRQLVSEATPELEYLRAPRGAMLYSSRSGHGLEEVSLDLMADP